MQKAFVLAGVALALVIGLLARPVLAPAARAEAAPSVAQATTGGAIHTSGSAVIRVQPDRATIRFGVQTFGASPRAAQAENEAIVTGVLDAIRAEGVEAKDIGTDYFSVRPEYDYGMRGKPRLLGYWSENGIQVTLRDVNALSALLVAALDAGATSVDDLTFTTTRLRELRDEARGLAVKAAIEKAGALAEAAGVQAGAVTDIREQSWSYYSGRWNSRGQYMSQAQNVMQEAAPADAAPPEAEDGEFSLGQIVVQAQVEVDVAME